MSISVLPAESKRFAGVKVTVETAAPAVLNAPLTAAEQADEDRDEIPVFHETPAVPLPETKRDAGPAQAAPLETKQATREAASPPPAATAREAAPAAPPVVTLQTVLGQLAWMHEQNLILYNNLRNRLVTIENQMSALKQSVRINGNMDAFLVGKSLVGIHNPGRVLSMIVEHGSQYMPYAALGAESRRRVLPIDD